MRLRAATDADLPRLGEIERLCFSDAWSERALALHLANESCLTLVAEDGEEICASLLLSCLPPEGEVYRIAVLPQRRRGGIGKKLLDYGMAELCRLGVKNLYLDVRAGNTAAIGLYEGAGFTVCGRRAGYYRCPREDAVLMERELF